jgi:hypothetical protein
MTTTKKAPPLRIGTTSLNSLSVTVDAVAIQIATASSELWVVSWS